MNKGLFAILVVITTALMGSSFAIGKIGLMYSSPLLLVGIRFSLAGILMALFVFFIKRPHPKRLVDWLPLLVIGFFQTAGVMGCIFISLRTITAGESSILTFMNPLLVVIFGTAFMGLKYRLMQWLGVILGLVGVFITLGLQIDIQQGTVLGFGAAVSWAVATLLIKKWGEKYDVWVMTAYQMLFGGLILLLGSALLEKSHFVLNQTSLFIVLWLAIMASIVQFTIWFYLLKKGDPGKVSAFLFLAPFFGVLSGWLILNEHLKLSIFIGGAFIFVGIFLVNWTKSAEKTRRLKSEESNR